MTSVRVVAVLVPLLAGCLGNPSIPSMDEVPEHNSFSWRTEVDLDIEGGLMLDIPREASNCTYRVEMSSLVAGYQVELAAVVILDGEVEFWMVVGGGGYHAKLGPLDTDVIFHELPEVGANFVFSEDNLTGPYRVVMMSRSLGTWEYDDRVFPAIDVSVSCAEGLPRVAFSRVSRTLDDMTFAGHDDALLVKATRFEGGAVFLKDGEYAIDIPEGNVFTFLATAPEAVVSGALEVMNGTERTTWDLRSEFFVQEGANGSYVMNLDHVSVTGSGCPSDCVVGGPRLWGFIGGFVNGVDPEAFFVGK